MCRASCGTKVNAVLRHRHGLKNSDCKSVYVGSNPALAFTLSGSVHRLCAKTEPSQSDALGGLSQMLR